MRAIVFMTTLLMLLCLATSSALACLWDYDTLKMERQRFPETLELITGKFLRHSKSFYEWRIEDRLKKIKNEKGELSYYDDLAVAYDKTGQQQKAIEIMQQKEKQNPGLYETYANLGTFYIHSKQFDKGLTYIKKAIKINPDAHFGREVYQQLLVEYVLFKMRDESIQLPLSTERRSLANKAGFWGFLFQKLDKGKNSSKTVKKALKGILGMMKFGKYDSPILLEALGDLLGAYSGNSDAKLLATRAYLKASYSVENPEVKAAYRELANQVLNMQTVEGTSDQLKLVDLEKQFQKELSEAKIWYKQVEQDEQKWIKSGKNPEEEFTKKYYQKPVIDYKIEKTSNRKGYIALGLVVVLILVMVGLLVQIPRAKKSL